MHSSDRSIDGFQETTDDVPDWWREVLAVREQAGRELAGKLILDENQLIDGGRDGGAMSRTISATEVRARFEELLRNVAQEDATYIVERDGEPRAVVLSIDEYDRLSGNPTSEWRSTLRDVQEAVQRELAGRELLNVNELIDEGR